MGPLWLGGAEGLTAQNFTQITGADTGFPEGGGISQAPAPLDIVRVTSSALRKIEKHPPPTIAAAQKKDRRCPKNWVAQKLGGLQPPLPPRLIRLWLGMIKGLKIAHLNVGSLKGICTPFPLAGIE